MLLCSLVLGVFSGAAQAQPLSGGAGDVLELPMGAAQRYSVKSPWKDDAGKSSIRLDAREEHTFELAPFEVLTLDLTPVVKR